MKDLKAFGGPCVACLSRKRRMKFCTARCTETVPGEYDTAVAMGDQPLPHLHVWCSRCEYQWLEQPLGFPVASDGPVAGASHLPAGAGRQQLPIWYFSVGECERAQVHGPADAELLSCDGKLARWKCAMFGCGGEWQTVVHVSA